MPSVADLSLPSDWRVQMEAQLDLLPPAARLSFIRDLLRDLATIPGLPTAQASGLLALVEECNEMMVQIEETNH